MYVWLVEQENKNITATSKVISRFVVTASKRAEDALYRLRKTFDTDDESFNEIKYMGYLPGIAETSQFARQKVFYILATYLLPSDPNASNTVKRVVGEFYDKIDTKLAKALGVQSPVGAIPTGPSDALDVAKIGLIISTTDEDPTSIREIIQSHVFQGVVEAEDIYIVEIRKLKVDIL